MSTAVAPRAERFYARAKVRGARIARAGGLTLLIGADAVRVRGAGVHLPERLAHRAGPIKRARPGAIVTVAAVRLTAVPPTAVPRYWSSNEAIAWDGNASSNTGIGLDKLA